MEVQIDTLIEKVKKHGIEEGEKQAQSLVQSAKEEAQNIVAEARKEAERIVAEAASQADTLQKRGQDALKQAQRDLLLTVREKLQSLLSAFVSQEAQAALSAESLQVILSNALSQWKFESGENIFAHLSPADAKRITSEALQGVLKSNGGAITVTPGSGITGGFRISRSADGSLQYDFTDETLAKSLVTFLTPTLQELLQ